MNPNETQWNVHRWRSHISLNLPKGHNSSIYNMLITVTSNAQGHKFVQWGEAVHYVLHQPWKAYVSGQTQQRWEIQEETRSKVHTGWFCIAPTSWRSREVDIRETNTHTSFYTIVWISLVSPCIIPERPQFLHPQLIKAFQAPVHLYCSPTFESALHLECQA